MSYRMTTLLAAALAFWAIGAGAVELQVGDSAPDFALSDQNGKTHALADYRGRWVVLYFYPKNDTPGCTTEACAFRDDIFELRKMGVAVLGVSTDDVDSHQEFAAKYHLPFSLLSDAQGQVAESYGSLFRMGPIRFASRHSFVIGPDGRIAKIYRSVQPKHHSDEVIGDLRALQSSAG